MDTLLLALIGHLVGDYIAQNDWMALNKKTSSWHCFVHCVIWTTCVCAFGQLALLAWIPLFVMHFIQDRTSIVVRWMRFIGQEKFMGPPCGPWSVIVVDNVWHVLQILLVVYYNPQLSAWSSSAIGWVKGLV